MCEAFDIVFLFFSRECLCVCAADVTRALFAWINTKMIGRWTVSFGDKPREIYRYFVLLLCYSVKGW